MDDIPFVAIGNDELGEPVGDTAVCPKCEKKHPVEFGTDPKTGEVSKLLGFVKCGKSAYLVAVDGKLINRN